MTVSCEQCTKKSIDKKRTEQWPPNRFDPFIKAKPFIAPAYGGPTEIGIGFSSLHLLVDTTYSNWLLFDALRISSKTG